MMDTFCMCWSAKHKSPRRAYLPPYHLPFSFIVMNSDGRWRVYYSDEKESTHCIHTSASFKISSTWEFYVWKCAFVMIHLEYAHGAVMSVSLHAEGIPSWMIHPRPTVTWTLVILCTDNTHSAPLPLLLCPSSSMNLSSSFSLQISFRRSCTILCNYVCLVLFTSTENWTWAAQSSHLIK